MIEAEQALQVRGNAANKLATLVGESGLTSAKATILLEKFQDFFTAAATWEVRASQIVVTDASQRELMAEARNGRLELKGKRNDIERERKRLKEESLRESKAIDGIANVLKALIVPIEEHLERQERFVEIQEAARQAEIAAANAEAERLRLEEEEKAKAAEQERLRAENEQLKAEAEEREKAAAEERRQAEAALKSAQEETEKQARIAREREAKLLAEKEQAERQTKAATEAARIAEEKRLAAEVTCPNCGHKFVPGEKEEKYD
jgi:DNA repair exonuclease SbcCD ATPase subunit